MFTIQPRSVWGARPPRHRFTITTPTPKLYLHHSASSGSDETSMRAIQNYHMDVREWSDIAYSFLIDNDAPDVDIFEGRGAGIAGGHTKGQNTVSHAICIIGNFSASAPKGLTLEALAWLVAHGHREGWWPDRITGGHRDAPGAETTCPGDALHRLIPTINERVQQILRGDSSMAHPPASLNEWREQHSIPEIPDWAGWDAYVRQTGTFAESGRWPAGRADLAWFYNSFVKPLQDEVSRQAQEITELRQGGTGGTIDKIARDAIARLRTHLRSS